MTRIEISFETKLLKKIDTLAELNDVDRSTVVRELVEIGLADPLISLLLRRPDKKGRGVVGLGIRMVAANERVKVTQSTVMRAPSVEAEIRHQRAEEEQVQATEALLHHLKPPGSL